MGHHVLPLFLFKLFMLKGNKTIDATLSTDNQSIQISQLYLLFTIVYSFIYLLLLLVVFKMYFIKVPNNYIFNGLTLYIND